MSTDSSMLLNESSYSFTAGKQLETTWLPLWCHHIDVFSQFSLFSFWLLLFVYLCAQIQALNMSRRLVESLLFSCSWFFLFSAFSFPRSLSSAYHPQGSAVFFNHSKLNGNTWGIIYSQIPRIPGYEVTQCRSWLSLLRNGNATPPGTAVGWILGPCGSGLLRPKQFEGDFKVRVI